MTRESPHIEDPTDISVTGILKGFDQLMNLVMDDVVEEYESEPSPQIARPEANAVDNAMQPRNLGLVVLRGPNIVLISPTDGSAGMCQFNPVLS